MRNDSNVRPSDSAPQAVISSIKSKPLPSFPGFCLPARHFSADKKGIEVVVRPRKGSVTDGVLELALSHSLGKLPEPESAHDIVSMDWNGILKWSKPPSPP
jgi:hypothetical protein